MLIDPAREMNKYRFEGAITEENLVAFVGDYDAGKLKLFLKSDEIPASNDEPVKVIVGK